MGALLAGIAFVAVLFLWCRFVPDEQARVRGMIVIWLALPFLDVAAYIFTRLFPSY